jgi:hypothetical protein
MEGCKDGRGKGDKGEIVVNPQSWTLFDQPKSVHAKDVRSQAGEMSGDHTKTANDRSAKPPGL